MITAAGTTAGTVSARPKEGRVNRDKGGETMEPKICPECGVPEFITSEHLWLNNGDIVQARSQAARLVFFESENIDPLLRNIQDIIGLPIEHIVITTERRAVRHYVSRIVPEEVKAQIRRKEMDPVPIAHAMMDVARLMGHGTQEFVDARYEQDDDDYYIVKMIEPFSVPLVAGTIAGATEAVLSGDRGVTYEQLEPGVYRVTTVPSPHLEGLKQRIQLEAYEHHDGDTELERCATCGGPADLSGFRWNIDRGVIGNEATGRRTVLMGPQELDRIFDELREELGETIDQTVVEAQRLFTRGGFYSIEDVATAEDFRAVLALRGLGNLKEITVKRKGLRMRLENAALPLLVVGMMQGAFETFLGVDSSVEWSLSEEGELEIEVTPV
jgi:hypothetical protein